MAAPGGSFTEGCGPEVLGATEEARDVLVASGVRPIEVDIADLTETNAAWVDIAWSEMAAAHGHLLRRPGGLHPETRRTLEYGSSLDPGVVLRARERAGEARTILMEALREADVLLSPTTPFPALPASEEEAEEAVGRETWSVHRGEPGWLTRTANLAGLPALSLPAGFSGDGLPLGVQLLGRPGEEATLLALGRAFQDATGHHRREPRFPPL
jgi:aspartyl-tRNA(Asn)/glutamyl-tRNA(Gln) amidotransferase subunit A